MEKSRETPKGYSGNAFGNREGKARGDRNLPKPLPIRTDKILDQQSIAQNASVESLIP